LLSATLAIWLVDARNYILMGRSHQIQNSYGVSAGAIAQSSLSSKGLSEAVIASL